MTIKELKQLCDESDHKKLDYAKQFSTLEEAWNSCYSIKWMWWLLRKLNKASLEVSIAFSRACIERMQHKIKGSVVTESAEDAIFLDNSITLKKPIGANRRAELVAYSALCAIATACKFRSGKEYGIECKYQVNVLRSLVPNLFNK